MDNRLPEGSAFLELIQEREGKLAEIVRKELPKLGERAPKCLDELGTLLSLTDRLCSCHWGCNGGDHLLERLAHRVVNSGLASLSLMFRGYYDESLTLTRGLGEIANLLGLFVAEPKELTAWRATSRKERLQQFGPIHVRRKLTNGGHPLPVDNERYRTLCEIAAHVTPDLQPQAHNPLGLSTTLSLQRRGLLVCLNELAIPVVFSGLWLFVLLDPPTEVRKQAVDTSRRLASNIGGVHILNEFPMLTEAANAELRALVQSAPSEDQESLMRAILEMADRGPPSPT